MYGIKAISGNKKLVTIEANDTYRVLIKIVVHTSTINKMPMIDIDNIMPTASAAALPPLKRK